MIADYAGAGARLTPAKGLALPPRRWAWQPKRDGTYVYATTDAGGRIAQLLHRSGELVSRTDADGLYGLVTGLPNAGLHGELEAHTEAGARARATRGWPALHVFDVSRIGGAYVARRPYGERYGMLLRWQAEVECYGIVPRQDWWSVDDQGDAHDPRTGTYVRAVPRDLRRLPIVPMVRTCATAEQLWRDEVELGGGEGLVAARLDAPLGARGAKRKIKATDTYECTVLEVGPRAARLLYGGQSFVVSAKGKQIAAGDVVELACDGWYEAGATPRFPRIVRVRHDLSPRTAALHPPG